MVRAHSSTDEWRSSHGRTAQRESARSPERSRLQFAKIEERLAEVKPSEADQHELRNASTILSNVASGDVRTLGADSESVKTAQAAAKKAATSLGKSATAKEKHSSKESKGKAAAAAVAAV